MNNLIRKLLGPLGRFTTPALALLVAFCGLRALAAGTPIVVWDHDFGTTEKTGTDVNTYTFDLNGNTLNSDGTIKITGTQGAKIDISTGRANATVIIKYRNLSKVADGKAYLLSAYLSDKVFDDGITTTDANTFSIKGAYSTGATLYGNAYTLSEGTGYAQIAFQSGSELYTATVPPATLIGSGTGGSQSALKFTTSFTGITLGGIRGESKSGWVTTWPNVEIEAVAVFDGYKAINDSSINNYMFPSDPLYGYHYNGNANAYTPSSFTTTSTGNFVDGFLDKAMYVNGESGYGGGLSIGDNDFTVVFVAKSANTQNKIFFGLGSQSTAGFGFMSNGSSGLKFGNWSSGSLVFDQALNVASGQDATADYHTYVVKYVKSETKAYYSVDGSDYTEISTPMVWSNNANWQIGSIHGGLVGSYTRGDAGAMDELRIYKTCLSIDDVKAIVKEFSPSETYTATISGDTKFSEITNWSPARPASGFDRCSKILINNTAAAKLTIDEDVTAASFAIQNTSGNGLTLGLDGHCITAGWNQTAAAGGVTVDATGIQGSNLARYAVAGAPYSYWYIRGTGTLPNSPSTMPTMPSGYTATAEKYASAGLCLVVTAPDTAKFGSVNINFAGGRNSQAMVDDSKVGSLTTAIGGHPVIGTSWNDLGAANQTDTVVSKYVKADGTLVTDADIKLTASQVNNPYTSGAAKNMLITGYIDDSQSPIVQISNIPFSKYRVILYRATDSGSTTFSAAQIGTTASNAKIYYGPNKSSETAGTTFAGSTETDWGKSDWRTGYAEGVNYIVSDVLEGTPGSATAYIYSHKHAGRAGVAAIQIVRVPDTYSATLSGTQNFSDITGWTPAKPTDGFRAGDRFVLTASGTAALTLDGAQTTSEIVVTGTGPDTLTLTKGADFTVTALTLQGEVPVKTASFTSDTALSGSGTIVYDTALPGNEKSWFAQSAWTGTVWLKNQTINNFSFGQYANVNSKVKVTGISGYAPKENQRYDGTLVLADEGDTVALNINNGYVGYKYTVAALEGDGTFTSSGTSTAAHYRFEDVSGFTGTINAANKRHVLIGAGSSDGADNGILVESGAAATIAAGKSWTASGGIAVNGTIGGAGTLGSNTTFGNGSAIDVRKGVLTASGTLAFGTGMKVYVDEIPTMGCEIKVLNKAGTSVGAIGDVTLYVGDEAQTDPYALVYGTDGVYVALRTDFKLTMEGDAALSTAQWSPTRTRGLIPGDTLTVTCSAATATFTLDQNIEIASLKVVSAAGKLLTLKQASGVTVSIGAYDFTEATDGIGIDASAAAFTADDAFKNYFKTNKKIVFTGNGANGAILDYSTSGFAQTEFEGHWTFSQGTHKLTISRDNQTRKFATGGTVENPTIYVKDAATVEIQAKNPCGWGVTANATGVIRIGDGAKVKPTTSAGTWYWAQQFCFDPGSTLEIATENNAFRVNGGCDENNPQFYMPASDNGVATISGSGSYNSLRLPSDSPAGVGFKVDAGSTLKVTAKVTSDGARAMAKYGEGRLEFTGDVSGYTGTLTINAGTVSLVGRTFGGSVVVAEGATLELGSTKINGTITNNGTVRYVSGSVVLDGNVTAGAVSVAAGVDVSLGSLRTYPANLTFDSGVPTSLKALQTSAEFTSGSVSISGLPAAVTEILLERADREVVEVPVIEGSASYTDTSGKISGPATWFDYTFTKADLARRQSEDNSYIRNCGSAGEMERLQYDTGYNAGNSYNAENGALLAKSTPWRSMSGTTAWPTAYTVAVYGNVPDVEKGCLVAFGSSLSGKAYLAIVRGANGNEILLMKGTDFNTQAEVVATMPAENATSAKHLVVFIKDGDVFKIYCDGKKITETAATTLGTGFQIGSVHGGVAPNAQSRGADYTGITRISEISDDDKKTAVEIGMIRIFNKVISDDEMTALAQKFPYVSQGGLYKRTINTAAENLKATDAWSDSQTEEPTDLPLPKTVEEITYRPSIELTLGVDASTLTVNEADVGFDNVTINGSGTLTFDAEAGKSADMTGGLVVNTPIVVKYGSFNISKAPTKIGTNGSITFDLTGFTFEPVLVKTDILQLTGLMETEGGVSVKSGTMPVVAHNNVSVKYKNSQYWLVAEPDRVATTVYTAEGMTAVTNATTVKTVDGDDTILIPGDTLVITNTPITVNLTTALAGIEVAAGVEVTLQALAGTTVIAGSGTVVSDGTFPSAYKTQFQDAANWHGTVWLKNVNLVGDNDDAKLGSYGNASSKVMVTGVQGWMPFGDQNVADLILKDGDKLALEPDDSSQDKTYSYAKFTGDGTFKFATIAASSAAVKIADVSDFTGALVSKAGTHHSSGNATAARPIFVGSGEATAGTASRITVFDGATINSGCGWEAEAVEFGATLIVKGEVNDTIVGGLTAAPAALDTVVTLKDRSSGETTAGEYRLAYDNGAVKVARVVTVTIPTLEGATVVVTDYTITDNQVVVPYDTSISVVYTLTTAGKLFLDGTTTKTVPVNNITDGTTATAAIQTALDADTPVDAKAKIGATYYLTLNAACSAAQVNDVIQLLADVDSETAVTIPGAVTIYGGENYIGAVTFTATAAGNVTLIGGAYLATPTFVGCTAYIPGTFLLDTSVVRNNVVFAGGDMSAYCQAGYETVLTGGIAYAVQPITYTITYVSAYDAPAADSYTVETASPKTLAALPQQTGYAVTGWYDNAEYTGEPTLSFAIPTTAQTVGNKTFYAKCERLVTVEVTGAPQFMDFTNATIVADVTSSGGFDAAAAQYVATVGSVEYAGVYSQETHQVWFDIGGESGSSASVAISVKTNGSDVALAETDTVFVFGSQTNWFFENATAEKFGKSGTWTNATAEEGQIVIAADEAAAGFVPATNMYGKCAVVTAAFLTDAPNDENDPSAGSQLAFRLATDGTGYKFQVWEGGSAAEDKWIDVTVAGVTPETGVEYVTVTRFDYSKSAASMTVNGIDVVASDDRAVPTAFALPAAKEKLSGFEFYGSGKLGELSGDYFDNTLFTDTEGNRYARIEDVPTNKTVVVSDKVSSVTVEPGKKTKVPESFTPDKIKVSYKGKSLAQYVQPEITDGDVSLKVTDKAKPTVTQMQMPGADGVKLGIAQPIAGLFYGLVEAGSIGDLGTATPVEKKQYTGEGELDLKPGTAPTTDSNVKYYRVRVTAE